MGGVRIAYPPCSPVPGDRSRVAVTVPVMQPCRVLRTPRRSATTPAKSPRFSACPAFPRKSTNRPRASDASFWFGQVFRVKVSGMAARRFETRPEPALIRAVARRGSNPRAFTRITRPREPLGWTSLRNRHNLQVDLDAMWAWPKYRSNKVTSFRWTALFTAMSRVSARLQSSHSSHCRRRRR